MIRRLTLACAGVALCTAGATQLFAALPQTVPAANAVAYLRTVQQPDGGFPDFSTNSNAGTTVDAIFAFASTGTDPNTVENGGNSPADYLAAQAPTYSTTPGGAAKLVAGVATLDLDPTSFGGVDLLAAMESYYDPATGAYGTDPFSQAFFMLAEASMHRPVPAAAVSFVEAAQLSSGGWQFCDGCGGEDTNTTSLLLRALIAAGVPASDLSIVDGLAFLKTAQQPDGGFPYIAPGDSDPNSTAYVIQAIVAAGQSIDVGGPWEASTGKTPLSALLSFQNPVTGALQFFGADDPYATYQGVPGLMLAAFPEKPAEEQSEMLTAIAPTSTNTPTATATNVPASPTSTPSITPTTKPKTHTPTSERTATTAPASTLVFTSTPVRGVLGDSAAPSRVSSTLPSTRLPNTGGGAPAAPFESWLLLIAGALALSGAALIQRGSR